jgi:hypothetical protein
MIGYNLLLKYGSCLIFVEHNLKFSQNYNLLFLNFSASDTNEYYGIYLKVRFFAVPTLAHLSQCLHIYKQWEVNNYSSQCIELLISLNQSKHYLFSGSIKFITVAHLSGAVDRGTALQSGRSLFRFPMLSLTFFVGIILPAALWPWVRLSF